MVQRSRVDLCASEELTKCVRELTHKCLVERLAALWVGVVKAVVYGLGDYVVELLEKLLLGLVVKSGVLDKSERDEVSSDSIKQELLMLLKFGLWIANLADYVPKGI